MISQVIFQWNQCFWIAVLFNKKAGAKWNGDMRDTNQLQQLSWTHVYGHWCSGTMDSTICSQMFKGPLHRHLRQRWFSTIKTLLSSAFLHLFSSLSQTKKSIFTGWTERWEHTFILLTKPTTMTVHKNHFQLFSHVKAIVFSGQKHQQALTCCRMYSNAAFQQAGSAVDMLGAV